MRQNFKLQSAMEYLTTYSWAILVITIAISIMFVYVFAPQTLPTNTCTFNFGSYCDTLVIAANSISTRLVFLFTNTQSQPLLNPKFNTNVSSYGTYVGGCVPNYVLPGGAMICNVTLGENSLPTGTFVSGKMNLNAIICPHGNVQICKGNTPENFSGIFSSSAVPMIGSSITNISVTVQNSTQTPNGVKDPIYAHLKLFGYPVQGATINFSATTNTQYISLAPTVVNTASNGTATSYIWSNATNQNFNSDVGVSFANQNAFVIVNFASTLAQNPFVVDGTSSVATSSAVGSEGVTLSTTQSSDVVVLFVATSSSVSVGSITDTSGQSLTWNLRGTELNGGGLQKVWEYYAITSSPLSGATITATLSSGTSVMGLTAVAISGANTGSPFDPSASFPSGSTGTASIPTVSGVTTNYANDIILGFAETSGTTVETAGSGYSLISATNGGGVYYIATQNDLTTRTLSGTSVPFGVASASGQAWTMITDAVEK